MNIIDRINASRQRKQEGVETPWGWSHQIRYLAEGVSRVDTAGHGGYFVASHLLDRIPLEHRVWAALWSGSENWYEEDCCWVCVAIAFPSLFTPEQVTDAKRQIAEYIKP